jgi:hypothetical protein
VDVVDKWLNLLEGYFFVHNFFDRENITFALLKVVPHVKDWWETFCEKKEIEGSTLFAIAPTWGSFRDAIKEQYYLLEVMTTCIQYGPHCGRKETKQCQSSPMSSIPCAPSWVSNIMSDIWCSSTTTVCIDTSRQKWNFWTSHPWVRSIDMSSKSSRSLNKRCNSLGLRTPHSRSRARAAPTHRTKNRKNMGNLRTTSPSRKQRRTMERQRRMSGSGATSIRAPRITLLIVSQINHLWLR